MFDNYHWWTTEDRMALKEGTVNNDGVPQSLARFACGLGMDDLRVYIAAPWVRKAEAIQVGKRFTAAGHTVTSRWFDHEGDPHDFAGTLESPDAIRVQAAEDIADVLDSDVLVVLNWEKSEGKAVETGVALQAGIRVISVGPRSNIFQTLGTEVATVEEALAQLSQR